ncbi:MAG: hypothetical protein NWE92_07505 [Candidatus Bathyarchaeota archaeon]|nr:hypothetical protein [Candidatus Bathyarchaeota archaeon]
MPTIQVDEETLQILNKIMKEKNVKSHNQVIKSLVIEPGFNRK